MKVSRKVQNPSTLTKEMVSKEEKKRKSEKYDEKPTKVAKKESESDLFENGLKNFAIDTLKEIEFSLPKPNSEGLLRKRQEIKKVKRIIESRKPRQKFEKKTKRARIKAAQSQENKLKQNKSKKTQKK